jgi:hypothetical protein
VNLLRTAITAFSFLLLLTSSALSAPTVQFCELMQHPDEYNGKLVNVRATWIYGFEWSYLHCLGCDGRVWLDTSELDEQSEKALRHTPKGAAIVNVDIEGIFQSGGRFGHMNGYQYQLRAHTMANPAVISKGMRGREKEVEIERNCACGGAKPR